MDLVQRKKKPNIYRKYWKYILAGVVSLGVHIILAYHISGFHLDQINNAKHTIEHEENEKMNNGILSINQYLNMQSHEASFLAKQIKSLDTSKIESFCKDFMDNNTEYIQLRILTEQGDETLRLLRKEGVLSVIPKERFQNKAHRNYFKKAMELDEFETYHSELNLDIEYGKPLEPLRITLRHYSPFVRNGEKYFVGLNWDDKKLFSSLGQEGLFLLTENQELLHGNIAELYKKTNIEKLTTSLAKDLLFTTKSFEMYTGQRLTIGTKRELKEFNLFEDSEKQSLYILWGGIFLSTLGTFSVIYVFAIRKNQLESERKHIEEIIFNAERFEKWKASNFIGIIQFDAKGGISDANDTLLAMLGYSRQDLLEGNLDWTKLTPPEYLHLDKKAMREAVDKGFWTPFEKEYLHKDGHRVPIIIGGSIYKEDPDEYIVFVIDLTERIIAEEALCVSEEKYRGIFEKVPVSILLLDRKGQIVDINPYHISYIGKGKTTREDYVGKNILTHPSIVNAGVSEVYADVLKGKSFDLKDVFFPTTTGGTSAYFNLKGVPLSKEDGDIIGALTMHEDITERQKIEETLLQSEKLRSIGTITSGVAHEFNNILAIISGNVQLLEENHKEDEELTKALSTINRATNDGAEISSKMLKFTKTKDTEGFVSFDINVLINQAIDFIKPRWKNMAQAKGINYHMDTESMKSVPSIFCSPTELREVFVNIINNALDAMPDDGRVSFSTWSGEDNVFISISDTGKGMSEDVRNNIFDPFFTTKVAVGTGLGMSTAYGIITRHGGKIEVESEIDRGTTINLQFPTTIKKARPIETSKPKPETKTNSLHILVVDDEEALCDILDNFLSKKGHLVRIVNSGREAIILSKATNYDLVLTDMAMPDVFGYDIIKALNELEKRPKIGIITGWDEKLKPLEDKDCKVDFIIKKPFDFSELTMNINDVFNTQ